MSTERLRSLLLIVTVGLACLSAFSADRGDESGVRDFLDDFAGALQGARADHRPSEFYTEDATHLGPPLVIPNTGLDVRRVDFIAENVVLVHGRVASSPPQRVFFVLRNDGEGWAIAASLVEPDSAGR